MAIGVTMTSEKEKSPLGEARAKRIRYLRELSGLSRQKFCDKYKKYSITYGAMQTWEDVRWHGVSEKGAKALVQAFHDEGIPITLEWLMFGVGEKPIKIETKINPLSDITLLSEEKIISQELRFFHQLNNNAVDAIVSDDGLAPCLLPGDYVAGQRYFDEDIAQVLDTTCIAQLLSGQVFVRYMTLGTEKGRYTLLCTNPNTTVLEPKIENVALFSAAPISWIRKPYRLKNK